MNTGAGASGGGDRDAEPPPRAGLAAWYALAVLIVVTFLSFLDRQVLLLLAEPIRKDIGLRDAQLGLLQGTGPALLTMLASYPLGWLADRFDRRWVLAGCILVWSSAVAACGLSTSFAQLMVASSMVGAGEAGLTPIVYALIPLLFVGPSRQLANSLFAVTAMGGGALALAAGGQLIGLVEAVRPMLPQGLQDVAGWRLSFFAAALPAPLMVLLVLLVRLPRRQPGSEQAQARPTAVAAVAPLVPFLRQHRGTFVTFYLGNALSGLAFGAVISWIAILLARQHGQTPQQVGALLGAAQLGAAAFGFAVSVVAARWMSRSSGVRPTLRVMWVSLLVAVLPCAAIASVDGARSVYALYAAYGACLSVAVMCYPTVLQGLVPSELRGRAAALQGMATMLAAAIAAPLVGWMSDLFDAGGAMLPQAIVAVAVPSILASAALLALCERRHAGRTSAEVDGRRSGD